jgi:hypothetical protein
MRAAICAKDINCMRFATVRIATSPVPPDRVARYNGHLNRGHVVATVQTITLARS